MPARMQVEESELRELLSNDATADATLEKYFTVDDSQPFSTAFRLRPEIEIIRDEEAVEFGMLGSTVVGLANRLSRRRRRNRYRKILNDYPNKLRLVSEGDSWFQHPLVTDTIDHLFDHYAIFSLGAAGDELSNMFREIEFLDALEDQDAKGLLLSAGGNDLMGGRFGEYLNAYSRGHDPRRLLNNEFFSALRQMLRIYRAIFRSMQQQMPGIKVFTHGYDYVRPGSGKTGKWLGKPMEDKGIVSQDDKNALIHVIIDEFNGGMKNLAAEFSNVEFIDMRETVAEGQWYDEIHPDGPGFGKVALKFIDRINSVMT